ncbi:hypothetical protein, partial [Mycobacterium sp.]|uniref:hypothetical protein n=1 Tax=Mycobacterium sp. TaxID=1785 RepID=UPI003C7503AD
VIGCAAAPSRPSRSASRRPRVPPGRPNRPRRAGGHPGQGIMEADSGTPASVTQALAMVA